MKKIIFYTLFSFLFNYQLTAQSINIVDQISCFFGPDVATFSSSDGSSPPRNIYTGIMNCCSYDFRIIWDSGDNRWELQVDVDENGSFSYENSGNSFGSAPNPPDLGTGTWTAINGCGGNLIQFDGSGTQSGLLPVELISFTAKKAEDVVALSWTTASELNNEKFTIEHSLDGKYFKAIGEVIGNGTTYDRQNYTFAHATFSKGINYYRLKQIDFDGVFEYSDIISITFETVAKIDIYPNPTSGKIEIIGIDRINAKIKVIDSFGNIVKEKALLTNKFDISELPKGLYFITINGNNQFITKRLLKE